MEVVHFIKFQDTLAALAEGTQTELGVQAPANNRVAEIKARQSERSPAKDGIPGRTARVRCLPCILATSRIMGT